MTRSTRSTAVSVSTPGPNEGESAALFKWIGPGVKVKNVVHYGECQINKIRVKVGDNVEIQLDRSSAIAQVRKLFETFGSDPYRAIVCWYYPQKYVPKRYHALLGKANEFELFKPEDESFVGYEEEIDAETIALTTTVKEIGENDTPPEGVHFIRYLFPAKNSKSKSFIPILKLTNEDEKDTRVVKPKVNDVARKTVDVTPKIDDVRKRKVMTEQKNVVTEKKFTNIKGQHKDTEKGVEKPNDGVVSGTLKENAQRWKNFSADEVLAELWKTDSTNLSTNTPNRKTNLKRKHDTKNENEENSDENIPLSKVREDKEETKTLSEVKENKEESKTLKTLKTEKGNILVDRTLEDESKSNCNKNSPFRPFPKRKESNNVSVFDFDESAEMTKKVLKKNVAESEMTKSGKKKKTVSVKAPKKVSVEESDNEWEVEGEEEEDEESEGEQEDEKEYEEVVVKTPKVNKKKSRSEATPGISERKTPRAAPKNMLQLARKRLHVSAVPDTLPCRDEQFEQIFSFVQDRLQEETGGCMYISGVPGTGKTATVREVVRVLKESADDAGDIPTFRYIEINGMKLTDPNQAYVEILKALEGKKATPDHAADLLTKRFQSGGKNENVVLLVDELDLLCTRKQNVMYNMFDWPTYRHSKLVVLAVANTMDLPERMMMNRVSSRLGLTRMTFQPYTFKQLEEIVVSRIRGTNAFEDDALQLVARKVAAVSGDARRCLDICRRAVEIGELDIASVKKSGNKKNGIVGMKHVDLALREMFSSPKIVALRCLSRMERMFMKAVISEFRRTGLEEAIFLEVYDQFKKHCSLEDGVLPPNMSQAFTICNNLGACRLLLVETGNKDIHQRVRLNVNIDDVMFAFKSSDGLT